MPRDEQSLPSTPQPGASFSNDQFQQLLAVLGQQKSGGFDLSALKEVLVETQKQSAGAMQKALRPENEQHPGKSAFSYPEGDQERPRPVLTHELWWNNFPVHKFPETHHWSELELMNQLKPGSYTVTRKDGASTQAEVRATTNPDGSITRMDVTFSVTREDKHYVAPIYVWCYQMTHPGLPPRVSFMHAMQAYLSMQLEDEQAKTPVVA